MKLFNAKMKVPFMRKKMMEKLGFDNFTYVIVAVYFAYFESVMVYRNTPRELRAVS